MITLPNQFSSSYKDLKLIAKIASPIMLSRLTNAGSNFVGMLMIAKIGTQMLAAGALISTIYSTLMMIAWAILFTVGSMVAKNYGSENYQDVGVITRQALILSTLISIPVMSIMYFLKYILILLHQPNEITLLVAQYFMAFVCGVLPAVWIGALYQMLSGIMKPQITLVITIFGCLVSISLSYILIYGKFGFMKLEILGLAYGNVVGQWTMFIATIVYILLNKNFKKFKFFSPFSKKDITYLRLLFSTGWPISTQYGIELLAYAIITVLMGYFGSAVLAAQQISIQCTLIVVMISFSIAQASSVIVGQAYGNNDLITARRVGNLSNWLGVILMLIIAISFLISPNFFIRFYLDLNNANNGNIIEMATIFLAIGAINQIFDSIKNITAGGLRGFQDTHVPMMITVLSCWLVSLPTGCFLAFIMDLGPVGLRLGYVVGLTIGATILLRRFKKFTLSTNIESIGSYRLSK